MRSPFEPLPKYLVTLATQLVARRTKPGEPLNRVLENVRIAHKFLTDLALGPERKLPKMGFSPEEIEKDRKILADLLTQKEEKPTPRPIPLPRRTRAKRAKARRRN